MGLLNSNENDHNFGPQRNSAAAASFNLNGFNFGNPMGANPMMNSMQGQNLNLSSSSSSSKAANTNGNQQNLTLQQQQQAQFMLFQQQQYAAAAQ